MGSVGGSSFAFPSISRLTISSVASEMFSPDDVVASANAHNPVDEADDGSTLSSEDETSPQAEGAAPNLSDGADEGSTMSISVKTYPRAVEGTTSSHKIKTESANQDDSVMSKEETESENQMLKSLALFPSLVICVLIGTLINFVQKEEKRRKEVAKKAPKDEHDKKDAEVKTTAEKKGRKRLKEKNLTRKTPLTRLLLK